ncbi:Cobalt-precorrin-2 C20-methyltransferase [hydrothermal vent metagenome]|uniref:Cobalt-precorrin-2 C20-methyltransferase n=1 Tax=hydrothermal vent metagenome TaxID=652676 RepID=A0A3B0TND5_9ZZZZ
MGGIFYLVGVGPGDPELVSLKAVRILGSVDVVAYAQKPGSQSMALGIAQTHIALKAKHMATDIPMLVERAPAQAAYDDLAAAIGVHLKAGRSVAYLCEGDPLFYGSAIHLLDRLGAEAKVEIIPGINSLDAAAAAAGFALAVRNDVFKILPAPLDSDQLRLELECGQAVAIIKLGRHFERVRAVLIETGHASGAVVVEYASMKSQKITPLLEFEQDTVPYFALVLCRLEHKK